MYFRKVNIMVAHFDPHCVKLVRNNQKKIAEEIILSDNDKTSQNNVKLY